MPKIGFLEQVSLTPRGMLLSGWAANFDTGEAPTRFLYRHGSCEIAVPANQPRADVVEKLNGPLNCGFNQEVDIAFDDTMAETDAEMLAVWADGTVLTLEPMKGARLDWQHLKFSSLEEFSSHFQNPAFRVNNSKLLVWAAKRALKIAPPNSELYMAGACVLVYRHLLEGLVPREEVLAVMKTWQGGQSASDGPAPRGSRLRWIGSVHLAFAYAYLSWGQFEAAQHEFGAICNLADGLESWPQAATNIVIAHFMASWLSWHLADTSSAITRLEKAIKILPSAAQVPIWSWHHFEEFRGMLGALQECFALLTILKGDTREHVLPKEHKLKFSRVSNILGKLAERGILSDALLPLRNQEATAK